MLSKAEQKRLDEKQLFGEVSEEPGSARRSSMKRPSDSATSRLTSNKKKGDKPEE